MNLILYFIAVIFIARWITQIPAALIRGYSLVDFIGMYKMFPIFLALDIFLAAGFVMFVIEIGSTTI
jgi:hypothetical protein